MSAAWPQIKAKMLEWSHRETAGRFRSAVRFQTGLIDQSSLAFSRLAASMAERLIRNGYNLSGSMPVLRAEAFDYGNKVGYACDVRGVKDPKASAIAYVASQYEELLDKYRRDEALLLASVAKISRARKVKSARRIALKALELHK